MRESPSILGLVAALLLSFVAGGLVRRAAAPNRDAPESVNVPTQAPQTLNDDDPSAPPDDEEALQLPASPGELLEAAERLARDDQPLEAALAFYQWLTAVEAEEVANQVDAWMSSGSVPDEDMVRTALVRLAQLEPKLLPENALGDWWVKQAVYAGKLQRGSEISLDEIPESFRDFGRKFIAARRPEFDLDWARDFGVPLTWYLEMWIHRGLDPRRFLGSRGALDPELVTAIFRHESTQVDCSAATLRRLLEKLDDPALVEAAKMGIQLRLSSMIEPLASLQMLDELGLTMPPKAQGGAGVSLYHLYHGALSERPRETADWILGLSPEKRKKALDNLFTSSLGGRTNTRGWLDLYLRLPREELPGIPHLHLYLGRELRRPRATLDWFEDMMARDHFQTGREEKRDRLNFLQQARDLGEQLTRRGVESAVARAMKIADEDLRQAVLGGIVSAISDFDLETARSLLTELAADERKERTADILQQELHSQPLPAVIQTLESLPENERPDMIGELIFDQGMAVETRAALMDHFGESNPNLFQYALGVVIPWSRDAPAETAAWLSQYADHPRYPRTAKHLVESWARSDLPGAANWVIDMESGEARDFAVEVITEKAAHRDPHAALQWAALVANDEKRVEYLSQSAILIDTHATESGEARAALEALEIPPEDRARVLQALEE